VTLDHPQALRLLLLMGINHGEIEAIARAKSQEEGDYLLGELRSRFKKGFKKLVLKLHPDQNKDPDAVAEFSLLLELPKLIAALKFKPPSRAPRVIYHTIFVSPISPPLPRKVGVPQYFQAEVPRANSPRSYTTDAARVANLRPHGVTSPRGR
jgi:hypothetical protein